MARKPKAPALRPFAVPVRMTLQTTVYVQAEDEEGARLVAENGTWEEDDRRIGEAVDWSVTGRPEPND